MIGETDQRGEMLRAFLAEHDEPCPACGYNLRGLTGEACPECAEALRLRVGMVEPRLGPFVAGLIGLACGAGFNGVMSALASYILLVEGSLGSGSDLWMYYIVVIGLVACVVGIVAWIRGRAWVRQRSALCRSVLVVTCWLLSSVVVIVFFAMGRS